MVMSLNSLHNPSNTVSQSDVYTDLSGLQKLKASARKDSQSAIPEAARQFEAVMISMMIKNLRKTGLEDPIFKSQAMDSYRDMYDQQLGMELSKGEGIGFARSIAEQIKYQSGHQSQQSLQPAESHQPGKSLQPEKSHQQVELIMPQRRNFPDYYIPPASLVNSMTNNNKSINTQVKSMKKDITTDFNSPEEFVKKLWPLAEKAAEKLGVSPEMVLSQAALETGWGKHIISKNKKSSFNLFNIKASKNWSGRHMEKESVEFVADSKQHTKAVQQKSNFKAYDSFTQSFDDYVDLVRNNTRYNFFINDSSKEMNQSEHFLRDKNYIKGIHKAGYATDPSYSDKILRLLKSEAIQNQLLNKTKLASK